MTDFSLIDFFFFFFLAWTTRAVTKLLEDLVFFVVDIPINGQDVLEITVNKPNRERQKLMREQNILKQVQKYFTVQSRRLLLMTFFLHKRPQRPELVCHSVF